MHKQKFDTKHLTQSKDAQDDCNEQIIQELKSNLYPATTNTKQVGFTEIHYQECSGLPSWVEEEHFKHVSDPEIERM